MLHLTTKSPGSSGFIKVKATARSGKRNIRDSRTRPHHLLPVRVVKRCFSILADLVKRRVSTRSKSQLMKINVSKRIKEKDLRLGEDKEAL